jgi:hypothetical protein
MSIAMIQMWQQLGLTQAALARTLRVALPTVGRWRAGIRQPAARWKCWHGSPAIAGWMRLRPFLSGRWKSRPISFEVSSWEEAHHVHAFLETLRNSDFAVYRPRMLRALAPVMKATDNYVEEKKRSLQASEMWIQKKLGRVDKRKEKE